MSFYKFLQERTIGNLLLEYKCTPEFKEDLSPEEQKAFEKLMNKYYDTKKAKKDVSILVPRFESVLKVLKNPKAKAKIEKLIQILKAGNTSGGATGDSGDIKPVPSEPEDSGDVQPTKNDKFPEEAILSDDYGLTDEFPLSVKKMQEAFDLYNQKYFEGKLRPIPFKVGRAERQRGCFCYSLDTRNKRMVPEYIKVSKKGFATVKTFRNTMVHEMLHYYVHCVIGHADERWNEAIRYLNWGNRKVALQILESSDETCHDGDWYRLAKEMTNKYPELTIKRWSFGSNGIYETDKEKFFGRIRDKYNALKTATLVYNANKDNYYVFSQEALKELMQCALGNIPEKFKTEDFSLVKNQLIGDWFKYKINDINDFITLDPVIVKDLDQFMYSPYACKLSDSVKRYLKDFISNGPTHTAITVKPQDFNLKESDMSNRVYVKEEDYSEQFKEYLMSRNNISEKKSKWTEEELDELDLDLDDLTEFDDEIGFIEIH